MLKHGVLTLCGILAAGPALANIDIVFNYDYDSNGFFTNPLRKGLLDAAASAFESRFQDDLAAITSSGTNHFDIQFFHPSRTDGFLIKLQDVDLAAGEVRIYVGAADLGSNVLGVGGPGGYQISGTPDFVNDAPSRGQGDVSGTDAVDFAPWGGSISFNSTSSLWYFDPNGVDSKESFAGRYDFYSVALHEIAHVLGFGTADSWDRWVTGDTYDGPYTPATPLAGSDHAHWADGTTSTVLGSPQEAAMDPTIGSNTRKHFTDLDYAAMQDIGWQVAAVPEADTWALLLAGLGLIGLAARRRAGC